jgi:hypothetical protein
MLHENRDPSATSGRGLAIVDALSTTWGVKTDRGVGKTVWFEVLLQGETAARRRR